MKYIQVYMTFPSGVPELGLSPPANSRLRGGESSAVLSGVYQEHVLN